MAEQLDLYDNQTTLSSDYDADAIQVLEGLTAVRKRPGMYIGSTSSSGLHHLVWEIVDNAVDEHLAKHCSKIDVTIHKEGSITVYDNGRGIPTGMHKMGIPTPQVVFTILHAGGKFGGGGYKKSGGLHGVGASVTNALSEWLEVEIFRDGQIYKQRFEYWVDEAGKEHVGEPVTSLEIIGKTSKSGTKITFKPDVRVFQGGIQFNYDTLAERLQELAFLNSGLEIFLKDERTGSEDHFLYSGGASEFVRFLNEGKDVLHDVIHFEAEKDDIEVEIAMQYNIGYTETLVSFVNSIPTRGGGTHETGFKTAFTRVMNEYARKNSILKEKDKNLEGTDLREGLMAVINIKMSDVEFVGQTKDQLGSATARSAVDAVVSEKMAVFLEENPQVAQMMLKKAVQSAKAREAARKAREEVRSGKKGRSESSNLNGKLTPAQSKDVTRNELFIVEGDSAGGSAKQGRDSKYQAILPLKGKPMNPEKAKLLDILKNDEYKAIISAIGAGVGSEFELSETNYNKIIIMTDADTDGAHIQVLLLTFFYRYMKPLVDAGKVYIAQPPLYKISKKSGKRTSVHYAWTDEELSKLTQKAGKNFELQRYKGLGEMNPEQLWETTMNPGTRILLQVQIEDAAKAERRVSTLMGDKVDPRKRWIIDNVDFTEFEE
ncbi:DNA topoisomerase 4 subunit B [Paenibacillus larvae subsp. larvae]|uniref:DNA topoisomerase (ATP-hydrolyzing) n=2 Tax=Paenibacillus larvae TaxID=1464 RepID=A0A1V0UNV3_9BACL|nr:DNA topoisomerase IV subunit B [Paenibacillus larvae]AQT86302.1 DNA topoisomerase IV subunit B [Paenibacillus larvae subsp. pulvifaciens]AQZ47953.1 DNA topoisomerase IV subunit B [Paenibacillus larvae subsp. pulvifaciens]ARF66953.1 DNA topoisomerase IV subunit B [Paenibacillus larvae subsp. pulvifaciens]AVF25860.1 DNA topoisomerase 4 subunit B [Paenibacillus larvae subsp. larvae]AVF30637.1 DNA topoisomerase 4 subunit B [Paenibacillus larvae subsp. larvae]